VFVTHHWLQSRLNSCRFELPLCITACMEYEGTTRWHCTIHLHDGDAERIAICGKHTPWFHIVDRRSDHRTTAPLVPTVSGASVRDHQGHRAVLGAIFRCGSEQQTLDGSLVVTARSEMIRCEI
jgi:hypothetical protein